MPEDKKIPIENLPQAPDMEAVERKRHSPLSENLPQAPDMETFISETKAKISIDIPVSADKQVVIQKAARPELSLEFPEGRTIEVKSVFYPFDGQWMPDAKSSLIGPRNFTTLQNTRYGENGLEGVQGYTKINTTALNASYHNIRNGYQLRTERINKSYVLVHATHTSCKESNAAKIYENRTAIPDAGDFEATALYTDAEGNLDGRFSDAPGGQVAYCNEKESCIWAGTEMPCAGFFSIYVPKITRTDITFSKTASPDTIVTVAGNFRTSKFKSGHQIIVSGDSDQNGEYEIVSISADGKTLTLGEDVLHSDEASGDSVTITVDVKRDHVEVMDYTEAVNNEINSATESATTPTNLDGTTIGNFWIVLSTRPLKGVKYKLRTTNGIASSLTCKYWDGDSFEAVGNPSDGTSSNSMALGKNGTFSFDSTASVAKPLHFEGLYFYAYLFELSAGSAVIYNVTVDAPFQTMKDVWDGVYRQPIQFQVRRGTTTASGTTITAAGTITTVFIAGYQDYYCAQLSSQADYEAIEIGAEIVANSITRTVNQKIGGSGSTWWIVVSDVTNWAAGGPYALTYTNPEGGATADYKDFTLEVNQRSFSDYPIGAVIDALTPEQKILIGFEERMSAIWFEMIADLVNTNTSKIGIGYWDGTQYTSPSVICDTMSSLVGKTFNKSGMVSWQSPAESSEFRQTLFGVNAYYYEISVNATLSGTEGGAAEIVIDTVKGIPAQNTVKPFKFPLMFKNRLMLCGYTEGKEGNRVDYTVSNAPDVHNGDESSMDGIQSLYFGGSEDLTCGIQLFNRFGSNIVSCLLMFKNTETYLLIGDGPDNYKIYVISLNIGCPAPSTLRAAETGYTFAEDVNRNVVAWVSHAGSMIFDGAAIIPVPGLKKFFDPAESECINQSAIKRATAYFSATHKEYNFLFPSGSSAVNNTKWLAYDLVKKRSYEKVVGTSLMPQATWPVIDIYGRQYIYAGIDSGYMMRLEHATSTANKWADDTGSNLIQVIETGDFFPSESQWDITRMRRFKAAAKNIVENASLSMAHFSDGAPTSGSGTSLTAMNIFASGNKAVTRATQDCNLLGWTHRIRFSTTISGEAKKGLEPIGWGIQFYTERQDE